MKTARARRLAAWLTAGDRVRAVILIATIALQLCAIGWDLPCSSSWENDAVAPRSMFPGVSENLTPGHGFRYPLLHPLAMMLLCLPVLLPAALRAPSLTMAALRPAMLAVPVMTTCAVLTRLLAVAMGVVTLAAAGRIAERLGGRTAARWAVLLAATNIALGYYGRTANLDGPALMWTALALERLYTVVERGDARDYRAFGLLAAAAVATKDQAYAGFVLMAPLALVLVPLLRPAALAAGRQHWRRLGGAAWRAALVYGLLSGALLNPKGFVVRLRTLTGPASQDYHAYVRGAAGVLANALDIAEAERQFFWIAPLVALGWAGVVLALVRRRSDPVATDGAADGVLPRWQRLLPILTGLGAVVGFALVVGRADPRFVLPLGFALSIHGGLALARAAAFARGRVPAALAAAVAVAIVVLAATGPVSLVLTQWGDARHEMERALEALPAGTVIETYGPLAYQPHFERAAARGLQLHRVGPEAIGGRDPVSGGVDLLGAVGDAPQRRPDGFLITGGYARAFDPPPAGFGHALPTVAVRTQSEDRTRTMVTSALAGRLPGFHTALRAEPRFPFAVPPSVGSFAAALGLHPREIHWSTGLPIWLIVADQRRPGAAP